ncbi:MAG: aldehyde dehydrogenase [Alphaproteobacteria bacterium]|nr:aldehyde dehydrogenase [Alphaproteobacteria bacterium]
MSLDRREAVRRLLADRGNMLVVSGLGSPTYDVAAAGDDDRNFYLWGAMGSAAPIGLGLAIAQPERRVLVITGDGELLMGLGGLASIAAQRPTNLVIVVLDNERYGETGMQKSHTAHGTDLAAVAQGCGFSRAATVHDESELDRTIRDIRAGEGPMLVAIKVTAGEAGRVLPSRDGVEIKNRFRRAIGV